MTARDTSGNASFTYSIDTQRTDYVAQRTQRRASVVRIASTYRHPMALADALESRTDALHLATLDQEGRIAARDGVYSDAEMLANAWLTLDEGATYSGAFHAAPVDAPVHTCQTRAEWAACWDDAAEAGSWLTRQWYARQEHASAVSEAVPDAVRELMGASSTYVADASDGLRVRDLTHAYRMHRVKAREQVDAEAGEDVREGYWRTYDRTQRPLTYRDGACAPGFDGRQRERDAVRQAQRATDNAARKLRHDTQRRMRDAHVISADLTALLARVRVGTSER